MDVSKLFGGFPQLWQQQKKENLHYRKRVASWQIAMSGYTCIEPPAATMTEAKKTKTKNGAEVGKSG